MLPGTPGARQPFGLRCPRPRDHGALGPAAKRPTAVANEAARRCEPRPAARALLCIQHDGERPLKATRRECSFRRGAAVPTWAPAHRPEQVRPRPTRGRSHSGESARVAPCFPAHWRVEAIAVRMRGLRGKRVRAQHARDVGQRLLVGELAREEARARRCRSRFPHGDSACQRRVPERVVS